MFSNSPRQAERHEVRYRQTKALEQLNHDSNESEETTFVSEDYQKK
jgi:hypothetical protein